MTGFAKGDHVPSNPEAGRVTGRIIRIRYAGSGGRGQRRRATQEQPQDKTKSDRSDHTAAPRQEALMKGD